MSKIADKPITIPKGVEIKIADGKILVKGPKGNLTQEAKAEIEFKFSGDTIIVSKKSNNSKVRALHGLYWSLVNSMIKGVTAGFEKELGLVGVGYRASMQGKKLVFSLGFSHPVEYESPEGINLQVIGVNKIKISGIDKQLVGQVAAEIRDIRKVEPYKGKGIRYSTEIVRKKAGKAAKAGA
jgi:large subunit ribosomal protein L6